MWSKWLTESKEKNLAYLLILTVTVGYFVYILFDSRYFFYDDFTALKFVAERNYWQVVVDSLISRNVDRHKFIGYLVHKALYDTIGLKVEFYFLVLFVVHTLNSFLVYRVLVRVTKKTLISSVLAMIFAYRFYLWWFSNIHTLLAGLFGLLFVNCWLSYLEKSNQKLLLWLWILWPMMVFSYGPSVLVPLALIPTSWALGEEIGSVKFRALFPFLLLAVLYLPVFVLTPDSLNRFASDTNPYKSDFSLFSFLTSQAIFIRELSGRLLPQSIPLTIGLWGLLGSMALVTKPKNLFWLAAFFVALGANSFFVIHTMFYYLYFPVVFLLIFFGQVAKTRFWVLGWVLFLAMFAPWSGLEKVVFRLHHRAVNFEKGAMQLIVEKTDGALARGETKVVLSNWEVTPNLQSAIDYQVIPYFLVSPGKYQFRYQYSRETETMTIVPK